MEFGEAFMNLSIRPTGNLPPAAESGPAPYIESSIMDVMRHDKCARAIFDYVPIGELVRSERVCKRWQAVVRDYMQGCRTLTFKSFEKKDNSHSYFRDNRSIVFYNINRSLPIVCKTLDKLGPHVINVILGTDEYSDIIASKCPNVQEILIILDEDDERPPPLIQQINNFKQLKHVLLDNGGRFIDSRNADQVISELLQDGNFESIEIDICYNDDLTGSFLQYLNEKELKSLKLYRCHSLSISYLLSAVHNLQNVRCLSLDQNQITLFNNLHLLLKEMTQLEELSLRSYNSGTVLSKELIKAISGLVNLKHLDMAGNIRLLNDSLLEELAQGCKKLEYLDLRGSATSISARGVLALCRREPTPIITLQFGFGDIDDNELESYFLAIKGRSMYQELERQGFLELTWDWFKSACSTKLGISLRLNSEGTTADNDIRPNLKIIMT